MQSRNPLAGVCGKRATRTDDDSSMENDTMDDEIELLLELSRLQRQAFERARQRDAEQNKGEAFKELANDQR